MITTCACFCAVPPKVLHYGLHWEIGNTKYEFDKHWHFNFDALQCPPWNMSAEVPDGGLFRHPPHPATYPTLHPDVRALAGPTSQPPCWRFKKIAKPVHSMPTWL